MSKQVSTPAATAPNKKTHKPQTGSSKKQKLIALLARKTGADVKTITTRLGWQAHTIRAAISGLRKNGYSVETIPGSGRTGARYRILDKAPSETTA